ncbi:LacI family DNA-binding transcriptional regulator [Streptococcus sp. H49]|uniref:LacI family DNA-binding transcriptional regulator n=1 Tax=Streptococcus huangxiaojuni TaxID=3237239 RepID=UPI0034A2C17B
MATIKDIAKMANVSIATVSRIMNGKGEASAETIKRVNNIIEELDYKPNKLAQSLSTKRSNLIAVVLPNLKNPFFGELATAIEKSAAKRGFRILLCNTNDNRDSVDYFLDMIADNFAFGAIISSLQITADDLEGLEKKGIKTVTIDRAFFSHPYSAININQFQGAYMATEHLIEKKAEEILFISGPKDDPLSIERKRGYLKCLRNHQKTFQHIIYGDFSVESGYNLVSKLFDSVLSFDAIFASNDLMAIGAIRACKDYGKRIPEDIKIIGNDAISLGEYLEPRLTTISQERKLISDLLIEELIFLHDKNGKPQKQNIEPKIVIRETT